MAKDDFLEFRKKKKYVFELRYKPILESFDKRGFVLQKFNDAFKSKIAHWRVSNIEVQLLDDPEKASKILSVDHKTARIIYEDCGSLQEFTDDTKKFIETLFSIYGQNTKEILRAGVRFQSIFSFSKYKTFDVLLNKLREIFINPSCPLSVNITDCQFILNHERGSILIGPVKKNEQWIKDNFLFPDSNIPEQGLGVDVDSYTLNTIVGSDTDIKNLYNDIQQLTLTTEKEILTQFL
jgi:hypothetical protein